MYEHIPTQLDLFKPETTKLICAGNTYLCKHTETRYGLKSASSLLLFKSYIKKYSRTQHIYKFSNLLVSALDKKKALQWLVNKVESSNVEYLHISCVKKKSAPLCRH